MRGHFVQPQIHRIPLFPAHPNVGERGARAAVIQNLLNDGEIHAGLKRPVPERYLVKYFTHGAFCAMAFRTKVSVGGETRPSAGWAIYLF